MLRLSDAIRIWLSVTPVDMRKQADGLCTLVASSLGEEPKSGHLFVFVNRNVDRVRVLFWDRNGYCLLSKRLERGRFRVPKAKDGELKLSLQPREFAELLAALDAVLRAPRKTRATH